MAVSLQVATPSVSLHHAARDGREQVVNEWIAFFSSKQAPPFFFDRLDKYGYSSLHYAAKFNRYDILVALIEAGADPNVLSSEEKFTPLHFCARYLPRVAEKNLSEAEEQTQRVDKRSSSWRAISYLINLKGDNKVEVNARDQYGVSPLHLACQRGNLKAVNVLLRSSEIDVCIVDKNGDTPLHEACNNGHMEVVKTLLEWLELDDPKTLPKNINIQNSEEQTPLHLACREGHIEIVKMFFVKVKERSDRFKLCKTADNEGSSALHLACESGDEKIVHALVLQGADINAVKNELIAPMHIAARYGHIEVADTLLLGDSEVDMVDESGQSPLHYAAEYNQVEMIHFLVLRKGDIAATDNYSFTPLLMAAYKGHIEAFEALLELTASIDDVDEDNKTAVHLAAEQNHPDLLDKILKIPEGLELASSTDARFNTPLHVASRRGHTKCVEVLLKNKTFLRIAAKDESNRTALHYAAFKGHVEVVKILLESHKDGILAEDENGDTPLHLAAASGYYLTVKELLKNNADCDARNAKLWTPIDVASAKGHHKVVELLIEADSEVDPKDKEKTTPLHHAASNGHLKVVKILLENGADTDVMDLNGNSPLDLAINSDHENIAMAIVQSKQWKAALRHTCEVQGQKTTPLRQLIVRMPAVANEVFNRCSEIVEKVSDPDRPGKKDYNVKFDYEFLEDFQDKTDVFSRISGYFKRPSTVEAEEIMNDGITSDSVRKKPAPKKRDEIAKVFNLEAFTTDWGPKGFSKRLHPLSMMVDNNRADLLKHPLVTSLLELKWRVYGRTTYLLNLFIYVIFVIFLTAFALAAPNPQTATCRSIVDGTFKEMKRSQVFFLNDTSGCNLIANSSLANDSERLNGEQACTSARIRCGLTMIECGECSQSSSRINFLKVAAGIVVAFALIRLIFEVFQIFTLGYFYLKDWINLVEITLFVLSIIFCFVFTEDCLCPTSWQWQVGCIAVFLAWIDFIIFFRKFALAGIYVLMFVDIFKTFWKLIFLTILLLIAFALSFYMALDDHSPAFARGSFTSPQRSLLKTMTMTTGEFEYDSIFRQFPGGAEDGQVTEEIPFLPVSVFLWIAFLILMPILLTNLLVGLAVDDIKGIQNAAELKRLGLQVELALSVEEMMPVRLRRFFIRRTHTIHANRRLNPIELLQYRLLGSEKQRFDSPENIYRSLHPPVAPIEQVQKQTDSLATDMKEMKEAIQDMKEMKNVIQELVTQNKTMEAILLKIAKQAGASGDDSTADDDAVSSI